MKIYFDKDNFCNLRGIIKEVWGKKSWGWIIGRYRLEQDKDWELNNKISIMDILVSPIKFCMFVFASIVIIAIMTLYISYKLLSSIIIFDSEL